jgi:predicted  nucleic acid-binding Zn-ribbon protein
MLSWQTVITLAGLVISLLGNYVQYQMLEAKRAELQQSQTKIDDAKREIEVRREASNSYVEKLQQRLSELDSKISVTKDDEKWGAAGVTFSRKLEDSQYAMSMMKKAQNDLKQLLEGV